MFNNIIVCDFTHCKYLPFWRSIEAYTTVYNEVILETQSMERE